MLTVFFPIAAFVLAVLAIIAIVLVVGVTSRWPGHMFKYLMLLITSASLGVILISQRILRLEEQGLTVTSEDGAGGGLLAKLPLVAVIGCSFAMCAAWYLRVHTKKNQDNRFYHRGLRAPNDIVIAFMVFYIAFSILPLFFGQQYYFHVSLIYPFFVFLALFLWIQLSSIDPVIVMKQCLALIVFTSLGAAVVAPQLSMQPSYEGLIPGFNVRLWGLTVGANALGSVAGMLLVLEAAEPSERKWLRNLILAGAAAALIMTQSKTSILGAVLGLSVILVWRLVTAIPKISHNHSKGQRQITVGLIATFLVTITTTAAWVMFSDSSVLSTLENKLAAPAVGRLATASGRTWIWEVAIQGGLENLLFGQGADFWSLKNRLRMGLGGAVHAHNLFLQAFSRSGLVGLATLIVFLYYLVRYSVQASKKTRGGSIALTAVFLMRAIFEVPIQPNAVLGAEFFAMAAYFFYVIDKGAKPSREVSKFYSPPKNAW
ncbi:MAG: O-antigen ligase family protein [Nitrosospira sp.]